MQNQQELEAALSAAYRRAQDAGVVSDAISPCYLVISHEDYVALGMNEYPQRPLEFYSALALPVFAGNVTEPTIKAR